MAKLELRGCPEIAFSSGRSRSPTHPGLPKGPFLGGPRVEVADGRHSRLKTEFRDSLSDESGAMGGSCAGSEVLPVDVPGVPLRGCPEIAKSGCWQPIEVPHPVAKTLQKQGFFQILWLWPETARIGENGFSGQPLRCEWRSDRSADAWKFHRSVVCVRAK